MLVKIVFLALLGAGTAFYSDAAILRVGDVVEIKVVGHSELSGRYTIGEKGSIGYPLLADEMIANISTSELMNDLVFRLAAHIDNPLVLVSVVEDPQITVTVLGQVADPGRVEVRDGASIQEAVKKAGGFLPTANMEKVKILRRGNSDHSYQVNLREFFVSGEVAELPQLGDRDMVVVLSHDRSRTVKVIGSVQKPGSFELDEKMNVFEMIYLAGGPSERADLSRVRRLSSGGETTTEEILDIQALIDRGDMDAMPEVEEGDVLLVYSRWFDWRTMLSIMNNTLLFVVVIQSFIGVFN